MNDAGSGVADDGDGRGPTRELYRLYAALHGDIAEGFVWVGGSGDFPPRTVVEIRNEKNGKRVFCEALRLEKNFERLYNGHQGTCKIDATGESIPLVMNYWYRAQLGSLGEPLATQADYALTVEPRAGLRARLRACCRHPQLVVRVSLRLGLLGIALGVISLFLSVCAVVPTAGATLRHIMVAIHPGARSGAGVKSPQLSLGVVLGWREKYGDLIGKSRDAVVERFGIPQKDEGAILSWQAAPRTGDRYLRVGLDSSGKVGVVLVGARPSERLDVMDVLRKATMFSFSTGTYTDSVLSYFVAETRDGRNGLRFMVTQKGVFFDSALFTNGQT